MRMPAAASARVSHDENGPLPVAGVTNTVMRLRVSGRCKEPAAENWRPPVILLGGENNALSVARALSHMGVHVYTINHPRAPARWSRSARWISAGGQDTSIEWRKLLLDGRLDHLTGAVLLCCSDQAIELVDDYREMLAQKFILEICPVDARRKCLDKFSTYECAKAAGIPCPGFWRLDTLDDLKSACAECGFPVLLKPRFSHHSTIFGSKHIKAENEPELRSAFDRAIGLSVPVVAMELIPGDDDQNCSYYTYLDSSGAPLVHYTKRLLRRHPRGKGCASYHISGWDREVADLGLRMFQYAGLKGLANVEFKRDPRDGKLKIIEVNARFTAGNEVVKASGIDLAAIAYADLTGRPQVLPTSFEDGVVMCDLFQDFLSYLERRPDRTLPFLVWAGQAARSRVSPVFRLTDPVPALAATASSASQVWHLAIDKLTSMLGLTTREPAKQPPGQCRTYTIDATGIRIRSQFNRILRFARGRIRKGTRQMWAARRQFYIDIWKQAAAENGASFERLTESGKMRLQRDGNRLDVFVNEVTVDTAEAIARAGDKEWVHKVLTRAGIPVPQHVVVEAGGFSRAVEMISNHECAVVVKPAANTGGGCGVSTNVRSINQLKSAIAWACTYDRNILVERQIPGVVYRILVMDDEVIDCIVRHAPGVTGDGKATIRRLIARENERRQRDGARRSQSLLEIDQDVCNTLASQGLRLSDVPRTGSIVRLKQAINENAIQENASAIADLCPAILNTAIEAARLVGLRLAGVDIICADPSVALDRSGGAVIEVNAPPGLYYHYIDHNSVPVASAILKRFFADRLPRAAEIASAELPQRRSA